MLPHRPPTTGLSKAQRLMVYTKAMLGPASFPSEAKLTDNGCSTQRGVPRVHTYASQPLKWIPFTPTRNQEHRGPSLGGLQSSGPLYAEGSQKDRLATREVALGPLFNWAPSAARKIWRRDVPPRSNDNTPSMPRRASPLFSCSEA